MSGKPSFFAELQRRHVYKVGAMYCVGGWLIVQIVTQVLPIFDVSALVQRVIVLAVVAGFPLAVVLSWLFDITPQGIVRTAALSEGGESLAAASQRRDSGRRLSYVLAGLLVVAVALFGIEHLGGLAQSQGGGGAGKKSVAVLPFENLSDDKSNAYFAEGMQDEILTHLAKVGALRVISRTSTQQYAAHPENLSQIGKQLGADNILEGSVQRVGNAVHVNVQLIEAMSDSHLWAESYNRQLDDVFGVEGEVAQTIAQKLNAQLNGDELLQVAAKPTSHGDAYDAYLHGLSFARQLSADGQSSAKAIEQFSQAVQLDPGFALAWAWLSREHSFVYFYYDQSAGRRDQAAQALETARRLNPDLAETRVADGYYRYWVQRDYKGARSIFEKVQLEFPNNDDAVFALAAIARRQGRWEEAGDLYRRGLEIVRNSFRRVARN